MLWGFSVPSRISIHRSVICALLILPLGALASGCEGDDPSTDDTSQGGHGAQDGEEPTGGQGGQTSSGGQGGQTSSGGQGGQGGQGGGSEFAEVKKELESLRNETRKLAEENLTCSKDSECDALAFGAKPCGGPWEYLPYSKTSEGADELLETATELRELERQYNEETGVQSDCSLAIRPDTECASGTCVAVKKR